MTDCTKCEGTGWLTRDLEMDRNIHPADMMCDCNPQHSCETCNRTGFVHLAFDQVGRATHEEPCPDCRVPTLDAFRERMLAREVERRTAKARAKAGCYTCGFTGDGGIVATTMDVRGTGPVETVRIGPEGTACRHCVEDRVRISADVFVTGPAWAVAAISEIVRGSGVRVQAAPRKPVPHEPPRNQDGSVTVRCG